MNEATHTASSGEGTGTGTGVRCKLSFPAKDFQTQGPGIINAAAFPTRPPPCVYLIDTLIAAENKEGNGQKKLEL